MVKQLSSHQHETIGRAVRDAETRTTAELATVIVAASGSYGGYVMFDAWLLASVVDFVLWLMNVTRDFPYLLAVQFIVMGSVALLPWSRMLLIRLLPKHIHHRVAAKNAHTEFMRLAHHVPADKPIVLLYISLAERYVHILHSRVVRDKIPASVWSGIVNKLTASMLAHGLQVSCVEAIKEIADVLAKQYPRENVSAGNERS